MPVRFALVSIESRLAALDLAIFEWIDLHGRWC